MTTRIKYVRTEPHIYITTKAFVVGIKKIMASYNINEMMGAVIVEGGQEFLSYKMGPYKTVAQIKKAIKKDIEKLGFVFEAEVRNKRKHKVAVEKVLSDTDY